MKKKLIALLLCLCIVAACIPTVSADYYNVSDWAKQSVDAMNNLGFLPASLRNADMSRNITRGQMCQMAVLVYNDFMGTPGVGPDSKDHFDDTNDSAINYAYEQGIVNGYGDGRFGPNDPLTRQDFFKIIFNLMATAFWDPHTVQMVSLDAFADADSVSAYAVNATQAMVTIGVVQGDGTMLRPKDYTTCEQAIAMFLRAYQYMNVWMNAQTEDSKKIAIYAQGYSNISTWAIGEVKEMGDRGMIPATLKNSDMSKPINRAQMCAVAVTAYEKLTGKKATAARTDHFTDTNDPAVNAAYELGIVDGYGNGKFGHYDPLTREQFFKIMANFMGVIGFPRKDSRAVSLSSYKDGSKVDSWAIPATRLMIYIGAVRGDGTNLNPLGMTKIEEALAIFLRCYKFTLSWKQEHPNGEPDFDETAALISDLISFAKSFEGYPYVYGGNGPDSFDCSGFVLYVYRHFGYSFARGAQEQYKDGTHVNYEELLPGDLVFFTSSGGNNWTNSSFRYITHVGLYLGNGYFIHASNPTRGVVIDTLWSGYYKSHFWGACRMITK